MAEASAELTITPKELGNHLRTVRRKKGLSLSEVARGAGLSRRELVAYERGKLPIPESDLWVLAGSCGVDVAELMPSTSSMELVVAADSTTISDTITQLRSKHEDPGLAPYLHTLHKLQTLAPGKRVPVKERELAAIADALGRDPATIDARLQQVLEVSPDEAARIRGLLLTPPGGRNKPKALAAPSATDESTSPPATFPEPAVVESVQILPIAPAAFLDAPIDAPVDPANGHNIDVFEELARLPEPVPLGDPGAPIPDLLAPQDPFEDPFAAPPLVGVPITGPPEGTVELVDGAVPVAAAFGMVAADAPPIDVALRQGSDTWDWGEPPLTPRDEPAPDLASSDATGWQPPTPLGGTPDTLVGFWEGTDEWTPVEERPAPETEILDTETVVNDAWSTSTWDSTPWAATDPEPAADLNPWMADEWPTELADEGPWDHQPDPEAVNTGFYVDWGTPETETPPAWEAVTEPAPVDFPVDAPQDPALDLPAPDNGAPDNGWDVEPAWTPVEDDERSDDALPPIRWHADGPPALPAAELDAPAFETPAAPTFDTARFAPEPEPEPEPEAEPELLPEPVIESFVTAGPDWQLGNALPLVEVRGQGALVMRRADERWALADVTTPPDFVVEVDVDFRSGPGLGVLFRAGVDDEGRMSGYSFDIDPIYDGGGYLVRQWQGDRELWNPIARVGGADPASMYGSLTVRLVVTGDHLTALVNGAEVLNVDSLKQASVDRGREAATGNRVGVQAWSSSDLVIDTLRVAET